MSIGMFASDIDGTIIPQGSKHVSPRTRAAVQRCVARGIPFVIASGRWFASARIVARELGLEEGYVIVADGGAVFTLDGVPLREWRMTRAQAEQIYALSLKYDLLRISFTRNSIYRVNGQLMHRELAPRIDYEGGFFEINEDADAFLRDGLECPYKMDFYSPDPVALTAFRRELETAGYLVVSSWPTNVEVMPSGTGKGVAAAWLAGRLGIGAENVMAFGDHTNDLDLMARVGHPVAVGNAVDELKAHAKTVCDRCDEDGVAKMIESVLEAAQ